MYGRFVSFCALIFKKQSFLTLIVELWGVAESERTVQLHVPMIKRALKDSFEDCPMKYVPTSVPQDPTSYR